MLLKRVQITKKVNCVTAKGTNNQRLVMFLQRGTNNQKVSYVNIKGYK